MLRKLSDICQCITALIAAAFFVVPYVFELYSDAIFPFFNSIGETVLYMLADSIPYLLLLVFSVMHKFPRFHQTRWIPVTLMTARLVLDIIAMLAEPHLTGYLTYASAMEKEYYIWYLIPMLGFLLFLLFFDRQSACMVGTVTLILHCFSGTLLFDNSDEVMLRQFPQLFWLASVVLLCVSMGEVKSAVGDFFSCLMELILGPDEDDDLPDYRAEEYQIIDAVIGERVDFVVLRTGEDTFTVVRVDKRPDGRKLYSIECDRDIVDRVLACIYDGGDVPED